MTASKILIVCDVQPDVLRRLPDPTQRRKSIDLIGISVEAARRGQRKRQQTGLGGNNSNNEVHPNILYTQLKFKAGDGYSEVNPNHPRLGVLRRLGEKNPNMNWFTSDDLSVAAPNEQEEGKGEETVLTRTTYLPHASDEGFMEALGRSCDENSDVTVVGYGPTVQAICNILSDVLCIPNVQILRECIVDENDGRRDAMLNHGLIFGEKVVSLVDFLEEYDVLHETVNPGVVQGCVDPELKYVCDTNRGGHLCLFLPYLTRDYGYTEWPVQTWYEEGGGAALAGKDVKTYYCPLGRGKVDLCDEPGFTCRLRLFLSGRQHLDEKDLLHELVPELMPPTFDSVESARNYAASLEQNLEIGESSKLLWFIKAVNQNGGRAVTVTNQLPKELNSDEQLQLHVPRPLLYGEKQVKFHVKTYQHISCDKDGNWQLYLYDLFYLATASRPWKTDDLSGETQITTMRTHRLYPDNEFRKKWRLSELIQSNMQELISRAVQQGKLQQATNNTNNDKNADTSSSLPQFEINSADWMLDEDGRIYLIECNGIPVLYDPTSPKKQVLVTKGLRLYDRLYQEDPKNAVVNDSDLIREALELALKGRIPPKSLWKHLATIPSPATGEGGNGEK